MLKGLSWIGNFCCQLLSKTKKIRTGNSERLKNKFVYLMNMDSALERKIYSQIPDLYSCDISSSPFHSLRIATTFLRTHSLFLLIMSHRLWTPESQVIFICPTNTELVVWKVLDKWINTAQVFSKHWKKVSLFSCNSTTMSNVFLTGFYGGLVKFFPC